MWLYISNFKANYINWWSLYLLWNCPQVIVIDLTDDKSISAQVMAWFRQATRHYLSQSSSRYALPCGPTGPHCIKGSSHCLMGSSLVCLVDSILPSGHHLTWSWLFSANHYTHALSVPNTSTWVVVNVHNFDVGPRRFLSYKGIHFYLSMVSSNSK